MNPNYGNGFATTTDVAAAEKAIVQNNVDMNHEPGSGGFVKVYGQINLAPGTTTSAVVLRIRRGSGVGGTVVKTLTRTLAAATTGQLAFFVIDEAPAAGGQYTLTVTQTAGAAAGTVNDALIVSEAYPQG